MMILPISRSWIFSRTAQRLYLCGAISSMAFTGTWIGASAAQIYAGYSALPPTTAGVLHVVQFLEAVGASVLWVGMLYFWFAFDQSSWPIRAFCFLILFLRLPFCWALYYFFVYRRQFRNEERRTTPAVVAHG
jgi:hypothetical protein